MFQISKFKSKKDFFQRINSLENDLSKKRNKDKAFLNIDKSMNSYISSKNYDILKWKLFRVRRKKNYFNYNNKNIEEKHISFDARKNEEKKELIKGIDRSFNKLKLQNSEMKKYQSLCGMIKEQNKTNQYLLYQLIKGEKEKVENSKNDTNENNLLTGLTSEMKKEIHSFDSKTEKNEPLTKGDSYKIDFFLTKTNIIDKNAKKHLLSKIVNDDIIKNKLSSPKEKWKKNVFNEISNKKRRSQINFLKKELNYYNKAIDKDNKKLEKFKKKEKISKYIEAQNELELQNKEIEDLIKIYKGFHKKIKEYDTAIFFYKIKNDNYISSINEIKNIINKNSNTENLEQNIPKMEIDKKAFEQHLNLYKTEINIIKKEIEGYKNREKSLNDFVENNLIFWKEKDKINKELSNSCDLEQKLKKKLEVKNKQLEDAKNLNLELNEYIQKSELNKKNKLEEMIKYENSEQERIKKIKKEIDDINKEMQKYNYQKDVEENDIDLEINSQKEILNQQKCEIEQLNKEEKLINVNIDKLNKELESITNKADNKNNELQKLIKSIKS